MGDNSNSMRISREIKKTRHEGKTMQGRAREKGKGKGIGKGKGKNESVIRIFWSLLLYKYPSFIQYHLSKIMLSQRRWLQSLVCIS